MDHCYISGSFCSNDMSTRDIGIQTTLTTADIKVLEEKSTKLEDPEKLMRELFVNKVVKDDKNVQMYTGLPSKTILNSVYGMELVHNKFSDIKMLILTLFLFLQHEKKVDRSLLFNISQNLIII